MGRLAHGGVAKGQAPGSFVGSEALRAGIHLPKGFIKRKRMDVHDG
jgi:hypothetical protein